MFDIGGLVGGIGGIVGGMMQAEESAKTRDMNWAINVWNMQQRERERNEAIAMALKQQKEQKLGSTDIRGTRTKFVPGQGWVTTGSPELLEMMKLQDAEQRKVLTQDLPMRRKVMERNYARGLGEEAIADTYRRKLANLEQTPTRSDAGYAGDLYNAMAMGLREASRDAGRRVFTQGMRTGQNSNFADIAGRMQEASNDAYTKAALQAKLMSRGQGAREKAEARAPLANLYNLFATRAQQVPDVQYRPQAIDTAGTMSESMRNALVAGQDVSKLSAMKGGELDYLAPLTGMGNAIAGGAAAIGSSLSAGMGKSAYDNRRGQPQQQQGGLSFGATGGSGGGGGNYYQQNEYGGIGGW